MVPKVITTHVYPPIPQRSFDWMAHYEGFEEAGDRGYGRTEQDAIDDLIDNCEVPKGD